MFVGPNTILLKHMHQILMAIKKFLITFTKITHQQDTNLALLSLLLKKYDRCIMYH